jgi:hypothetical protein
LRSGSLASAQTSPRAALKKVRLASPVTGSWLMICAVSVRRSPVEAAVFWRYCSMAVSTAACNSGGGHGLLRNLSTCASLTAAIAERRSVWPVSRMRAACGTMLRALARNVAPSMRGMRMSEISTEMRSSRCSISSASAPLSAVSTS